MIVRWSAAAIAEVDLIAERYREVAPQFGTRLLDQMTRATERLALFPESGRIVPEYGEPHVREIVVRPYRLIYSLGPEGIEVMAVFHGAMILDE